MNRTPLKRRTPLRAKRWGIPRRPRLLSGDDLLQRDWCLTQPCIAASFGRCGGGVIDPHHAGKKSRPGGRHWSTRVPICRSHHEQITGQIGGYGVFQSLGPDGRRELQDAWIAEATARRLSHGSRRG